MPDFYCLSGKRTTRAETILSVLGQGRECYILEARLTGMEGYRLPIVADRAAPDIMRQVQTIAGSLILVGRAGRLAGIALVLSDRRNGRRRPVNAGLTRVLRHGTPTSQKCHGTIK